MALIKSIEHSSGAIAAYWKIAEVHIGLFQPPANSTLNSIAVVGYLSEQLRRDEKQPLHVIRVSIQKNDIINLMTGNGNIASLCYTYLKTCPEFSGATDC